MWQKHVIGVRFIVNFLPLNSTGKYFIIIFLYSSAHLSIFSPFNQKPLFKSAYKKQVDPCDGKTDFSYSQTKGQQTALGQDTALVRQPSGKLDASSQLGPSHTDPCVQLLFTYPNDSPFSMSGLPWFVLLSQPLKCELTFLNKV